MLQIIWTYRVKQEKVREFERYYGASGDWAQFFRRGAGYLGTTLLRSYDDPLTYATIDQWDSRADYQLFRDRNGAEYQRRDQETAGFTEDERLVGYFETL